MGKKSSSASSGKKSRISEGPVKERSCTDVICLLLFILTWIAMLAVAIVGFAKGDPTRLLAPVDSAGNRCGYTPGYKDRKYLLFYDVARCVQSAITSTNLLNSGIVCNTPQVCVKACPNANALGVTGPSGQETQLYCRDGKTLQQVQALSLQERSKLLQNNTCAPYYLKSEVVLSRCLPTILDLNKISGGLLTDGNNATLTDNGNNTLTGSGVLNAVRIASKLLNLRSIATKVWADFEKTWIYMVVGFVGAIVTCFVFIFLASFFLGPFIYLSMIGSLALLALGAYESYKMYKSLKNGDVTIPTSASSFLDEYRYQTDTYLVLGIVCTVFFSILALICLFLLSRIRLAIAVIKESSRAMLAIKSTFFFPLFPAMLQCLLFAYFVGVALFLVTSATPKYALEIFGNNPNTTSTMVDVNGSMVDVVSGSSCIPTSSSFKNIHNASDLINCGFASYDPDKVLQGMQLFHLVGWLWTVNWISAMGQCVLAGAFSSYYWQHKSNSMPALPLMASLKRTLFYHTGSLAFGAAIITIVQLIRAALVLAESRLKQYNDNKVAKFLLRCLQCFFYCLEKFLKFINKNAYIEIAVYGYNFCKGARKAFKLLLANVLRVATLNGVTSFLLFMGRMIVTGAVAVVSYIVFKDVDQKKDLNYFLGPVIILTVAAYFISASFFDTFDMAVDTIFLCVLEDLEHHDGSAESPYYMSKSLQKILKVKAKKDDYKSIEEET
eukprot:scpid45268/ scgid16126/ Choline transporter-like protein 2; Solute carrier family 44 member 2